MDNTKYSFSNCRWLWIKDNREDDDVNTYAQYIDYFTAVKNGSKIMLHISADSEYVAWVNGRLAGFGQYADFPEYKIYDSLDITDLVNDNGDKNTLCILHYYQGLNSSVYQHGLPGVIFGITKEDEVLLTSGFNTLCRKSPEYASGNIPLTTPQLSFIFEYDFNQYDEWNMEEYVPKKEGENYWFDAFTFENTSELLPRPIKKLILCNLVTASIVTQGVFKYDQKTEPKTTATFMQKAYLGYRDLWNIAGVPPLTSLPSENGINFKNDSAEDDGIYVVLDLQREESGSFELDILAPKGTVIDIAYGEQLDDLRVRSSIGGRNFSATVISNGSRNKFARYIKRFGCRYIQLYVHAKEFTLFYAGLHPTNYPVVNKGFFKCSDSLHNKIYDTCLRTLLLCMHEHYEDCPWREQALYTMDSRNQMLCGYYAFGEYEFARESIRLLGLSQRKDGFLELCAPAKVPITIPSFTLIWIVQLQEYVLYSGDIQFALDMWKNAEQIIRTFWMLSRGSDLVPPQYESEYWNFYEWADCLFGHNHITAERDKNNNHNFDAPLNAFYYMALRSAVTLAKTLAEYSKDSAFRDLEAWYEMLAQGVRNNFDQTFWDSEKGLYATYMINGELKHYAELTNALALYAGLVPEAKKERVASVLASDNDLVKVTLSYSIFKYEALLATDEKYGKYVFDDITDKWGYMLYNKATTFWETINGSWDFGNAGSLCHGWSAVPVLFYYKYVLGISPQIPGFKDYKFSPVPTPILAAEGKIPSGKTDYYVSITPHGFKINKEKH